MGGWEEHGELTCDVKKMRRESNTARKRRTSYMTSNSLRNMSNPDRPEERPGARSLCTEQ